MASINPCEFIYTGLSEISCKDANVMSSVEIILVTSAGAVAGVILWFFLLHQDKSSSISLHRLFLVVVVVGIVCRITFSLSTPNFNAPDEQSHFNYIKYLYEKRSFPVQTTKTGSPTNDWEYYQPPVYYLASVPAYWISHNLFDNNYITVRVIRLLSIVLWMVNVIFTLKILDNLHLKEIFIRIFVISMVCLLPTYTFLSSVINNDNLLITMGGGILYLLSSKRSFRSSILMGILLGLALLTKLTAVIYIFVIAGLLFTQWMKRSLSFSSASTHFVLIIMLAAIIWLPWAVRNLNVYGDITAESIANNPAHWPSIFHAIVATQNMINESFWAVSGIYNDIGFLPHIGIYVACFAIIGILYGMLSSRKPLYEFFTGDKGSFMTAMALAVPVNMVLALRFGVLYMQGQGRFLFPMLIPISLFTAIGIALLGVVNYSKRAHIHIIGFFIFHVLSFTSFSLGMFTRI